MAENKLADLSMDFAKSQSFWAMVRKKIKESEEESCFCECSE